MAPPPLLLLQDTQLNFGTTPLLNGATLSVSPGERLALIGRNGSGKSTLLKIAAGETQSDGGTRFVQPGATVRYLEQEPDLSAFPNVLAYVEAGLTAGDEGYRAHYLLEQLGLTGEEKPANLSGGEARRAALARALAPSPDILLLDEPTNHLDVRHQLDLLALVARLPVTSVVALHDLNLAALYCDHLALLHQGRVVAAGTPEDVLTETRILEVFGVRAYVAASPYHGRPQVQFLPG
jgi:ATP-binding cassette subfamily F protein uup